MNKLVKDALVLTCITLIAGFALGLVYEITKAPIERAHQAALKEAYSSVFPDASSYAEIEGFESSAATDFVHEAGYGTETIDNCVEALDGSNNVIGYVFTVTTSAGYGGDITFSVGITKDGIINGYSITSISETAGLGMKAKDTGDGTFSAQFINREAEIFTVTKSGASSSDEVDAISAATITSRAMTGGINACVTYFESIVGGAANE